MKIFLIMIMILSYINVSALDISLNSIDSNIKVSYKKKKKRKRKRRLSCNTLKSCTKYSKCKRKKRCKKIIAKEKKRKEILKQKNDLKAKEVLKPKEDKKKLTEDSVKIKKSEKDIKKIEKFKKIKDVGNLKKRDEKGKRDIKGADFKEKLSIMLNYINKSISILKKQIINNPHAPFLADLYLEIGNLNAQKANTLYYIQMERMESDNSSGSQKKFSVVIEASKEAISIYELLVRDFPEYHKIPEVLYLLALINSSIDNNAKFLIISEKLIKEYPETKEAMQTRMLLGKFYFNKEDYKEALELFLPVAKSSFNFVKNQAIYNIGQLYIRTDKPKLALKYFRKVILDENLEKNGLINEVSITNRKVNTSLKREALMDSIRPFTILYPNHKNPEKYYAKLAPTEILYLEVIEKLAFRYINLGKYNQAIKLLRVLSERSGDPEKVINIYQEVLTIIPLNQRINIEVEEIQFVLEKFYMWFSFYKINPKLEATAKRFIEIQIRELGTRNHDIAKRSKNSKKVKYFKRALKFYQLYLGFFKKTNNRNKIAINLADVYYRLKMFPESGNMYLRIYKGEFGKENKSKKKLIENALNALQQDKTYSFYDNMWRRGLLLTTIKTYFKMDKKKRNNDQLNFIYAKTEFEQGMYKRSLKDLYLFVKKFPNSKYVVDSGELILNYFNTSGDYEGLEQWSSKLLRLNFKDKDFKTKLEKIRKQAKLKTLDLDIKKDENYNVFNQGKSYYNFALNTKDKELKNIALERALIKSREERNLDLFFKTANYLSTKEKNRKKRLEIYNSVANEYIYIGRHISAFKAFGRIFNNKEISEKDRKEAFTKALSTTLALKYYNKFKSFIENSYFKYVSEDLKEQLMQEIATAVEFDIEIDPYLINYLLAHTQDNNHITSLYKARKNLDKSILIKLNKKIDSICRDDQEETVCLWRYAADLENQKDKYLKTLENPSLLANDINRYGAGFVALIEPYSKILNSDDSLLRVYIIVQYMELYQKFSDYLKKVAEKNPELKVAILEKISDSLRTKNEYSKSCKEIVKNSEVFISIAKYCDGKKVVKIADLFPYNNKFKNNSSFEEFNESTSLSLQKEMLIDKNGDTYLDLADSYLTAKKYNLANAVAVYGISLFNEKSNSFTAILGCSTLNLGLLNEAKYYLSEAKDYQGIKTKCLEELKKLEREK